MDYIIAISCATELQGGSMFAVKAKIYGVLYNPSSSIAFDETSTYWSAPNSSYLLCIGHHTVVLFQWPAFRNHGGSTFTEKDRNKLKYRIAPKRT